MIKRKMIEREGEEKSENIGRKCWQFHAAGTFAKDFCYDSTKLLFLLETFMPASLNAVICEG